MSDKRPKSSLWGSNATRNDLDGREAALLQREQRAARQQQQADNLIAQLDTCQRERDLLLQRVQSTQQDLASLQHLYDNSNVGRLEKKNEELSSALERTRRYEEEQRQLHLSSKEAHQAYRLETEQRLQDHAQRELKMLSQVQSLESLLSQKTAALTKEQKERQALESTNRDLQKQLAEQEQLHQSLLSERQSESQAHNAMLQKLRTERATEGREHEATLETLRAEQKQVQRDLTAVLEERLQLGHFFVSFVGVYGRTLQDSLGGRAQAVLARTWRAEIPTLFKLWGVKSADSDRVFVQRVQKVLQEARLCERIELLEQNGQLELRVSPTKEHPLSIPEPTLSGPPPIALLLAACLAEHQSKRLSLLKLDVLADGTERVSFSLRKPPVGDPFVASAYIG